MTDVGVTPKLGADVLRDIAVAAKPSGPVRIQTNLVARLERRILDWFCVQLPDWITPDHLTAIGLGGAILAAAGYAATAWRFEFALVACLGLLINWFGDSLDGSLARHRKVERPKFGYFVDHSVDALSTVILMAGIGASCYASMSAALFALVGYLLMNIHVFIKNNVTGRMFLTFAHCGPTEMRIAVIFFTMIAYTFGGARLVLVGAEIWPYSLILYLFGTAFIIVFAVETLRTALRLQREELRSISH